MRIQAKLIPIFLAAVSVWAQPPQGGRGGPPPTPKAGAPIDLTGYWVSVVTEDWRFRMFTPAKGDYPGVPVNGAGRGIADAWDPAKDEAAGEQCKSYGAAAIMRVPSRFHITWDNDTTLKIEADAGTQTRVLHFNTTPSAGEIPSWQGYSVAEWQTSRSTPRSGSLKVTTTNLRPGFLRKNGVPYSNKTTVTEYYDLVHEPDGVDWIIVKTIVDDPTYLTQPFITSTNLKKQRDASGWKPSACSAR